MICLLPMCAYLSETSRMVQIYKALKARGAAARIATHGGVHEQLLRRDGIAYDLIEPYMDAARRQRFVMSNVGIGDPGQSMYDADEVRAHVLAEAAYFAKHGVSAVVTGFTVTALLSTRLASIPLVVEHAGAFLPRRCSSATCRRPRACGGRRCCACCRGRWRAGCRTRACRS